MAYYRNTETKGDKFEVRGKPGVFVGYTRGTKGYKIYDIKGDKIIISRDVNFFEGMFPFSKLNREKIEEEVFEFPIRWENFQSGEPKSRERFKAGDNEAQASPTVEENEESADGQLFFSSDQQTNETN